MTPDELRIQSFLKLGYFIDYDARRYPLDFSHIDKQAYRGASASELVPIGIQKLTATFSALFRTGQEHVVPLSGGLDSRLILGAVLEQTEARNVYTYTFGIPGTYDYDLGCLVAKEMGTRHVTFSLDQMTYHEDELLDFARRSDCQALQFNHPPIWELDRRYRGATFWSGYVGDAVAGSHLHDPPSKTLLEAKRLHMKNRSIVRSTRLHTCDDDEFLPFVGGGAQSKDALTFDEQVLFDEAVAKFTEPLVLFRGPHYLTPLINTPWMDFMFSAPNEHRLGEALMIRIARAAYPKLFGLPAKNSLGFPLDANPGLLRVVGLANKARKLLHQFVPRVRYPHTLYNDFNEGVRRSPDLRAIVLDNIKRLRARKIVDFVDFDGLLWRHMRRIRNHGDALIVLASLELVLRARESAPSTP